PCVASPQRWACRAGGGAWGAGGRTPLSPRGPGRWGGGGLDIAFEGGAGGSAPPHPFGAGRVLRREPIVPIPFGLREGAPMPGIDRRDFLRRTAAASLALAVPAHPVAPAPATPPPPAGGARPGPPPPPPAP